MTAMRPAAGAASSTGRSSKSPEANWAHTLNVNLTGSLRVAQGTARLMMENPPDERKRRGVVIFTGSWFRPCPARRGQLLHHQKRPEDAHERDGAGTGARR